MKKRLFKSKLFLGATSLLALGAITISSTFFSLNQTKNIEQRLNNNDVVYSEITGKPVSGLTYDVANQLLVKNYDILQSFFKTSIASNSQLIDYSTNIAIRTATVESNPNGCISSFDLNFSYPRELDNLVRSTTGDWALFAEPLNWYCINASTRQGQVFSYVNNSGSTTDGANYRGTQEFNFSSASSVDIIGGKSWQWYNTFLLNLEEKSSGFGNAYLSSGAGEPYAFSTGTRGVPGVDRIKVSRSVFDYWKFRQNDWKDPGEEIDILWNSSRSNQIEFQIDFRNLDDAHANNYGYDKQNYSMNNVNVKLYDADAEARLGKNEALLYSGNVNLSLFNNTYDYAYITPTRFFDFGTGSNNLYIETTFQLNSDVATKFETTQMPYWYTTWKSPIRNIPISNYDNLPVRDVYSPKVSRGQNSVKVEWNSSMINWTNIKDSTAYFVIYRENEDGSQGSEISRTEIDNSSGSLNSSSISVGGIYPNESYIFKFEYINRRPAWVSDYDINLELDSTFYDTEPIYSAQSWRSQIINTEAEFNQAFVPFSSSTNFSQNFLIYDPQSGQYLSSSDRYTYTGENPGYGGAWSAGFFPWVDTPRAGFGFKVGTVATTDIGIKWSQGGSFNPAFSSTEWLSTLANTTDGGGGAIIGYTQNDVIGEKRSSWQIETNALGEVAFKSESTSTGGRSGGYLLPSSSSYNPSTSGVTNGVNANFAQANAALQSTPYYFQLHRIVSGNKKGENINSPVARSLNSKIDNQNLEIRLDSNFSFATTLNSNQIRFKVLNQNGSATSILGNITSTSRTLNLNLATLTRKQKYKLEVEYDLAQDAGKNLSNSGQNSTWKEEFEFTYDWFDSSQFSELEITKIDQQSNLATIGFQVLDQSIDGEYIRNNFNYFVSYDYYGIRRKSSNFSYDQRTQILSTEVEIDWNFNYSFELNIQSISLSNRFTSFITIDNGEDLSSNSIPFDFGNYQTHISFIASTTYNDQDLRNNTLNVNLDLANSLRPNSIRNNVVRATITDLETNLQVNSGYIYWSTGASSATGLFNNIAYGRYSIEIEYQFSYTLGSQILYQLLSQTITIHV